MRNITILTFDSCWAMNVMIVNDFFTIVERLQTHHNEALSFSCQIVSVDGNTVRSASGSVIHVNASLAEVSTTDLVIIPPIEGKQLGQEVNGKDEIVKWLQQIGDQDIPIVSISTGAFLLAEAGLLENKLVATHWAFLKYFRKKYPTIHFTTNKSYTLAKNIYSTGSFNGCMDVLIHYISLTKGEHFAQQCAAHSLLTSPELISPVLLGKRNHVDEAILNVQDWIEENHNKHFSILEIANQFAFSERNLKRRFKLATDLSPIKYLQDVRLEKAKRLLISTEHSVSYIAYSIGYENCSFFIRLFKRNLGVTPQQWRLQ
jgi:transcriptional regulator GlxA family with amidase domain